MGDRRTAVIPVPDQEVVAAIVAGDPDRIAEAYDRSAMPLNEQLTINPGGHAVTAVLDISLKA
jgi:hypothetical protein